MKYKKILLVLTSALALAGCSEATTSSSEEGLIDDGGDQYVDVLPSETKDGPILHCFDWTYKQIEENLENIAKAGFKSVQTSPVQQPKSGGAFWWAYYQPVSLSIADNSLFGTKEDLKHLCEKAKTYGISVIVDIVFNHLGNIAEDKKEFDGTPSVSLEVEKYEPEIYKLRNDKTNPTFHHNLDAEGSGVITQFYPYGNLPDLNTAHPLVQERCLALLKECIDVGVDGFRFDAAKHIETPNDEDYPSDFWPNTLGKAKTYYREKEKADLFAYGEVLNDVGVGRTLKDYTDLMAVTDSGYIGNQLSPVVLHQPEKIIENGYSKNTEASNLITWVESHDTYVEDDSHSKFKRVRKMWAILSSRKDSRGLFFARPDELLSVAKIGDYSFEDEVIASANRFHNRFIEASETELSEGTTYINVRKNEEQAGAIFVNLDSTTEFSTDKLTDLPTGVYYDQITGMKVDVIDGKCQFNFDAESGICILTRTKNDPHPEIILNERVGGFVGSKTLSVEIKNASEAYYQINGGEKVTLEEKNSITITSDMIGKDGLINIKFYAKNGNFDVTKYAHFNKVDLIPGGFNIVNFNLENFEKYEVYMWTWTKSKKSKWVKEYSVKGTTILFDNTGLDGFLIGLFPKGYVIKNVNAWDDKVVKQTQDITGEHFKQGFFDAQGF